MAYTPDGTYFEFHERADAPVVVFIHGLGLSLDTWRGYADYFEDRYSVLSYDLCGHGRSQLPQAPVNLTLLARQLCALLDHLQIKQAALVGFSLGGMINRRFALDYPDRLTALAILNSPHERSPEDQLAVEKRASDASGGGPEATIEAALARWFTDDFTRQSPDVVDWVRQTVLANNAENYAAHRWVLAAGVKELIRPDPPLGCPALVMTSALDSGSTVAMAEAIAGEIAGAELLIIPGCKHLGLLEYPEDFAQPVRTFLDRHLPT